jgi:glycosyltransferase involved in cell wall biosynthesis
MLELAFEAIKVLSKKYKDLKLKIIGSGPDINYYKKLAVDMKITNNVIFFGFMKNGIEFNKLMSTSNLGLAFYKDEEDYIRYTEPAKIKYYFSFGIPAIVSDVPATVNELKEKKLAFIVKNNSNNIAKTIDEYFLNEKMQKIYKTNVKKYLKEIDINKILDESFRKTKF